MKVEAFKQGNGLFIPMNELLEKIPDERVVLNRHCRCLGTARQPYLHEE